MSRQFFVGGNFKMNPASREAKRTLIKTINDATLDPNTGEKKSYYPDRHLLDLTNANRRGRHRPPGLVPYPHPRPSAQRRQGRGSELPL